MVVCSAAGCSDNVGPRCPFEPALLERDGREAVHTFTRCPISGIVFFSESVSMPFIYSCGNSWENPSRPRMIRR